MAQHQILLERFVLDDASAAVLDNPTTLWVHSDTPYSLPEPLASKSEYLLTRRLGRKTMTNETTLSLNARPASVGALCSTSAYYRDQIVTHEQPDQVIRHPDVSGLWLDADGELLELNVSQFPNNLGSSVLLICRGSHVVIGRRSEASLISPGTWDVTSSGSFRLPDRGMYSSARDVVVGEALRELSEETQLVSERIVGAVVAAFTRDLRRGGHPDVHVLARSDARAAELHAADDLVDMAVLGPVRSRHELAEVLRSCDNASANVQLWSALAALSAPHLDTAFNTLLWS